TILFSGGTLTQASGGGLLVGRKNSAVLSVSGDAFLSVPGTLSLGEFAGFTTVCNIDGGVVAAPRILSRARIADGPNSLTSILNLNGGTLRATSSERFIGGSGTDLNQYLTAAYVKSGGAIIDSQAYTISINQVLNRDPDLGTAPDGGLIKRGTGSLTLSTNATYTGVTSVEAGTLKLGVHNTLMAGSRVLVSSNATFDVNGKSQTLAGLGGSGTVANNSLLSVTQTLAPGGTNVIGALTLAATPAGLSGVFLADVAADGRCDRLHVQGDLDLSALALAVADTSAWNRDQQYVIASYTGTLTGPFASAALPDRWRVRFDTSNRKVFLSYDFGLLIMVR
ncbi:MAG: autotransporter-associated beta strand repeat-containing protein, partial [Kiritimatiellae bacterium]|nr:autotransporter-associated beta strand repeat-containing protein [Kiritimatiellia bacterium]